MKKSKIKLTVSVFYYLSLIYSVFLFALLIYNLYNYVIVDELVYSEDGKYIIEDFGDDGTASISIEMFDEMRIRSIFRLVLLSIYFFIVSLIFKHVRVDSIFSKKSIRILTLFGILNFIPFLYAFIINIVAWDESWAFIDAFDSTASYLVAGVLSLFIASIFKQGLVLKQENDLTI